MPIEAHVKPLPSELTTPPVTKMCLAIAVPLRRSYRAGKSPVYQRGVPGENPTQPISTVERSAEEASSGAPSAVFAHRARTCHDLLAVVGVLLGLIFQPLI